MEALEAEMVVTFSTTFVIAILKEETDTDGMSWFPR